VDTASRFAEFVGRQSPPLTVEVERGHVRRFVEAVGDTNPIYVDEVAARAAGYERIPAPPTFAAALRPIDPRQGIDLDWKKLLHGEQQIEYQRPLWVGDRITLVARIAEASVKKGKSGEMDQMVLETVGTDERAEVVFRCRSVIMVRR
jgi:acyl dehydratase